MNDPEWIDAEEVERQLKALEDNPVVNNVDMLFQQNKKVLQDGPQYCAQKTAKLKEEANLVGFFKKSCCCCFFGDSVEEDNRLIPDENSRENNNYSSTPGNYRVT